MLKAIARRIFNKKTLGVLCIVLALVWSFVVMPAMFKDQKATQTVVTVTGDIAAGTVLTDSNVELKEVGAYNLPSDVLTDKAQAVGSVATVKIVKNDLLMTSKINTQSQWNETHSEAMVPEGSKLVSLTIPNPAAGAAGYVIGGDKVDVLYYDENSATVVSNPLLSGLTAYSVLNANLHDVEKVKNGEVSGDVDLRPAFITLVATQDQATALVKVDKQAGMHLVFRG